MFFYFQSFLYFYIKLFYNVIKKKQIRNKYDSFNFIQITALYLLTRQVNESNTKKKKEVKKQSWL